MTGKIAIEVARNDDRDEMIQLLASEQLPTMDLPTSLDHFFIAKENNKIIGLIGLEHHEKCGLLRSLVVKQAFRNQHIAALLISRLEEIASEADLDSIYLLTESAPGYFEKKGYSRINREEVPVPVQQSSEFSHVCPTSAIVMKKSIKKNENRPVQ